MDTQSLKAFIAIVETGSFSQAAEQLHLTQPAVSKRISALEEQLNCRLFDRIGRRITLTESGRTLLPGARRILRDVGDTIRDLQELDGQIGGRLTLGISHHIGLHRLPPVLQAYHRAHPQVRLDIAFLDSEQACEKVAQGALELGVITLAPQARPPLQQLTIWTDELLIALAPDHPLATHESLTLADLSRHTAILPGLNTYTGQIVKALFERQQLPLDIGMSTHYLETIKMMVAIGLGWGVLPRTMMDATVVAKPLQNTALTRALGCVYHRERSLSNAARAFIERLQGGSSNPGE